MLPEFLLGNALKSTTTFRQQVPYTVSCRHTAKMCSSLSSSTIYTLDYSSQPAIRRTNSSPDFHRLGRLACSSSRASHGAPAAALVRDHYVDPASAGDDDLVGCLLEDGQLTLASAQGQIDQHPPTNAAPMKSRAASALSPKCATSTALRNARRLAGGVPIAAAAVGYLLVLDVANRNTTRPPFWGAAELQAQFMGLGIGEDPCPRSPPPSPPVPPPGPPALPSPPSAPAVTVVGCGWWCGPGKPAAARTIHTSCGISKWNRPERWLFKYIMWSWLFAVESCQGHATVLLVLLQALLQFSFTMDAGVNNYFDDYAFCCSSYAYYLFLLGLRPGRYLRRRAAPSQEAKGPGVGLGDTIRCASRLAGQCSWGAGLRWVGAQPSLPRIPGGDVLCGAQRTRGQRARGSARGEQRSSG